MNELLRTLCDLPGISGFEDAVRNYIRTALMPYADEMHTDAAGNLVVFKRGRKGENYHVCVNESCRERVAAPTNEENDE